MDAITLEAICEYAPASFAGEESWGIACEPQPFRVRNRPSPHIGAQNDFGVSTRSSIQNWSELFPAPPLPTIAHLEPQQFYDA